MIDGGSENGGTESENPTKCLAVTLQCTPAEWHHNGLLSGQKLV